MPKSTAVSSAGGPTKRLPSSRAAAKTPWSSAWARQARISLVASRPDGQGRAVPAPRRIRQRHAVGPLQGQDPLADTLPGQPRGPTIKASLAMTSRSSLGAAGLHAQVKLQLAGSRRRFRPGPSVPAAAFAGRWLRPAGRRGAETSEVMATRSSMPGRSTLTATLRPSSRSAGWAWAMEAAATGGSKARNRLSVGRFEGTRATSALWRSQCRRGRRVDPSAARDQRRRSHRRCRPGWKAIEPA